jgi:hypothetical protein
MDGWAAHTGGKGQRLEAYLSKYWGITMLQLPSRFSHLNSSEHCWSRSKGFGKRWIADNFWYDGSLTVDLMSLGIERITHYDLLKDMIHDGYGVEQWSIDEVVKNSTPSYYM